MRTTIEQVEKLWERRNEEFGIDFFDDILFKGSNHQNIDIEISEDEIASECGDYSEDSYYLVMNVNGYGYGAIHEIIDIEDLITHYCYH